MGLDVYAHVGFGFIIYEEDNYIDPIFDIVDELSDVEFTYEGYDVTYHLDRYTVQEALYGAVEGVTLITFGASDYPTYALVIDESVVSSDSWGASALAVPKEKPEWKEILQHICEKTGVTYKDPDWLFGAYYSH